MLIMLFCFYEQINTEVISVADQASGFLDVSAGFLIGEQLICNTGKREHVKTGIWFPYI